MPSVRRLVLPCLAVLALAVPAAPATAGTRASASSTIGVAAEGFTSYFRFDARPGATRSGRLVLINRRGHPQAVALTTADAFTGESGGGEYGLTAARREGRWLRLSLKRVVLGARARLVVPFSVRVPVSARPGDHFGGLVVSPLRVRGRVVARGRSSRLSLRFRSRLVMAVQTRVPGPTHPQMVFTRARFLVQPAATSLGIGLRSPGNVLLSRTHGDLAVSQHGDVLFRRDVQLGGFLPHTAITFRLPWIGRPVRDTYHVQGVLYPKGAAPVRIDTDVRFGDTASRTLERVTGHAARAEGFPTGLVLALFVVLIAAGFLGGWSMARRRRPVPGQTTLPE